MEDRPPSRIAHAVKLAAVPKGVLSVLSVRCDVFLKITESLKTWVVQLAVATARKDSQSNTRFFIVGVCGSSSASMSPCLVMLFLASRAEATQAVHRRELLRRNTSGSVKQPKHH